MQANAFALPLPFNYLRLPPLNPTLRRVQLPPYHPAVGAKSPPLLRGSCSLSLKAQITSFPLLQTYPRAWFLYNPAAVKKSKEELGAENDEEYGGLPKEFYDDEWQARHQEKAKEWEEYRQKEEEKENRKIDEYREIGMRLKGYPEEEVRKARKLVSSFIRSAEEVEEKIEEAAEKGELNELVLMVIWNRLDLARRDEEKDVIRSLDLLYRRIETEILKRESTPAMRLLNDLLNLHDGFDDEGWLKKCRKCMIDTFPREDPLSMLVPAGFDIEKHQGRIGLPPMDDDDVLLRVDFVREVDALLQEVRAEQGNIQSPQGLDPESVATQLKQQEKQQTIHQVEALLELAVSLKW